jgi:hypothetical protein
MEVCSSLSCAWSWLGSNASSVIALSALATALAAALYVARQSALARKHDRLSAAPMLDIPFSYTVQATHPERPQLHCHVVLALANNGLGSAIIKRYEVYVDGKLIPVMSRTELEGAVLAALGLNKSQMSKISFFAYQGDHILPKDGTVQIIELAFIVSGQAAWDEVLQRFAQSIGARISYVSLYGEPRICEKGVVARPGTPQSPMTAH